MDNGPVPGRVRRASGHQLKPATRTRRRAAAAGMLSALLLLSGPGGASAGDAGIGTLIGPARVVDGDTLYVQGEKVRLYAVDAPEKAQSCKNAQGADYSCGVNSLQALTARVGTSQVRCTVKSKDQYGRNVAACSILSPGGAEDMGEWLVSNGYAVAYRSISKEYVPAEEKARAAKLGIWSGSFEMPAKWRYLQRQGSMDSGDYVIAPAPAPKQQPAPATPAGSSLVAPGRSYADAVAGGAAAAAATKGVAAAPAKPAAAPSGCVIKGNINSKGEKIYHTPESGAYERTIVEPEKGERYFCTAAEAEAAGFRAAIK
ncbi:Succinoglycan biosynthesis protein exoI [Monoraphidium neglectum]|uniref:Succinoglycan biosynthesis protein exoI n=1 Tax=Monoraphidium neglectum TaxID=145388 RepID=A0A0D2JLL1_9CHLO|nr:Succinoglycan biosynthesis protein exoI [Monoraphidium neglectum]KIZ00113.1 Succinoglycan biosynthesis protein exoI [Monoraphidium neglectum]|eukprot:XP_013899132.1 Succinoglycan biosynthesis protein exoI [Monoraphidium neglectum]